MRGWKFHALIIIWPWGVVANNETKKTWLSPPIYSSSIYNTRDHVSLAETYEKRSKSGLVGAGPFTISAFERAYLT